jgi:hypothetical protein
VSADAIVLLVTNDEGTAADDALALRDGVALDIADRLLVLPKPPANISVAGTLRVDIALSKSLLLLALLALCALSPPNAVSLSDAARDVVDGAANAPNASSSLTACFTGVVDVNADVANAGGTGVVEPNTSLALDALATGAAAVTNMSLCASVNELAAAVVKQVEPPNMSSFAGCDVGASSEGMLSNESVYLLALALGALCDDADAMLDVRDVAFTSANAALDVAVAARNAGGSSSKANVDALATLAVGAVDVAGVVDTNDVSSPNEKLSDVTDDDGAGAAVTLAAGVADANVDIASSSPNDSEYLLVAVLGVAAMLMLGVLCAVVVIGVLAIGGIGVAGVDANDDIVSSASNEIAYLLAAGLGAALTVDAIGVPNDMPSSNAGLLGVDVIGVAGCANSALLAVPLPADCANIILLADVALVKRSRDCAGACAIGVAKRSDCAVGTDARGDVVAGVVAAGVATANAPKSSSSTTGAGPCACACTDGVESIALPNACARGDKLPAPNIDADCAGAGIIGDCANETLGVDCDDTVDALGVANISLVANDGVAGVYAGVGTPNCSAPSACGVIIALSAGDGCTGVCCCCC